MVFLYRHVAKDPVEFFKFSRILENLLENKMAAKGFLPQAWSLSFERFLPKILDFLKNLLLKLYYFSYNMPDIVTIIISISKQFVDNNSSWPHDS